VEDIYDTEEIVVKPLWKRLKGLSFYAGATVLGDGRVALILDVLALGQRVGVIAEERAAQKQNRQAALESGGPKGTRELVLLCRMDRDERLGILLSNVARIEELPQTKLERMGEIEVMQYRGHILQLLRWNDVLKRSHAKDPKAASENNNI